VLTKERQMLRGRVKRIEKFVQNNANKANWVHNTMPCTQRSLAREEEVQVQVGGKRTGNRSSKVEGNRK
jgi:hypothetical protein